MRTIEKYKWRINFLVLGTIIILFILITIFFEDKPWIGNVLQTMGTILGIYLTVLIFLYSKEVSDLQFREHIEHLQELNARHIEALQATIEKQINVLQETNAKQISALQELTEKQIEALHKTTFEQISSFEHQIGIVTNKLSDSSILLAEILGRELEKSIDLFTNAVQVEEAKYKTLNEWKLLRSDAEKQAQLTNQWTRIQNIKNGLDYLIEKYNKVRNYLGFGAKQLMG